MNSSRLSIRTLTDNDAMALSYASPRILAASGSNAADRNNRMILPIRAAPIRCEACALQREAVQYILTSELVNSREPVSVLFWVKSGHCTVSRDVHFTPKANS